MKGKHLHFAAGLMVGAALFGGGTALAAGILAEPSHHQIRVDGQPVQMEAYAINGHNYVQLRDMGRAVGFNVWWDSVNNCVQVDSDAPYTGEAPSQATAAVPIPDGDAKLELKEGDVVQCDDGTTYAITDMSRYDANAFADGPLGDLPTATCDWSSFPEPKLPDTEVRRIQNEAGDYLFIRNLYETRRMQYTIQNLAGNHPDTSDNGKLRYGSKGIPLVRIQLTIDEGLNPDSFWPWRESELEKDFNACPPGTYQLEAWDVYRNGVFQYTEYRTYIL